MKAQNLNSYPVDIPEATVAFREVIEVDYLYPGLTEVIEPAEIAPEAKPSKSAEKGKP